MKIRLLLLFALFAAAATAQNTFTFQRTLNWSAAPQIVYTSDGSPVELWSFEGCSRGDAAPALPLFSERFALGGRSTLAVEINSVQWEPIAKKPSADDAALGNDLIVSASVEQERDRFFGRIKFLPLRRNGNGYERAVSFSITVRATPAPPSAAERTGPFTTLSVLSDGEIWKFGVANSGVYRLDYNYLKNELGISNLDNIDPRRIRIFGNGGFMLPERTDDVRTDDLMENAIFISGEQDGKFDAGDYILFYATGPYPMIYRPGATDPELTIRQHLYDRHAWYFLKIGDAQGLRISEQASQPAAYVTTSFDDIGRIEEDKVNLLDFSTSAQGSGKRWFGDYFYQTRQRDYSLNFPNLVPGSAARVRADFAARCGTQTLVRLIADGTTFSRNLNAVTISNNDAAFASGGAMSGSFNPDGDLVNLKIDFPNVSETSEGWLDFIEVNARRKLIMTGNAMSFRDLQTLTQDAATFRLEFSGSAPQIWDVSSPLSPTRQQTSVSGGALEFGATTLGVLKNFYAFYDNSSLPKPEAKVGKIANQNLHGIGDVHMAIIYHADFQSAAQQLAEHRRTYSGLDVELVDVNQLYNEFSSGAKDPTAIRDFARMLLERGPNKFDYLLLFGDGSFDPKNNSGSEDNLDFIPVFETAESFHPIYSHPSDDYFALLSPGEGGALDGALDIAVGRVTPESPDEAQAIVDKIVDYDQNPSNLGDWHLRLLYLADDQDGNAHVKQADKLATAAGDTERFFNLEKVYFDAYQQIATSGGQRFPDAKAAINSNIFKGALITQYIGHGGPRGWAQERVVDNNDIAGWDNPNRYPLIITATCTFGGYDDYTTLSGGEQALLKVKSGAIGLFTTVRPVFIDGNNKLTDGVQSVIFQKVNGKYRAIGDILKDGKNTLSGGNEDNARRFTLLGDPAMFLALPEYRVSTDSINGKVYDTANPDTLRALMPVELKGSVTDTLGNLLSNFNGKVFVTIFDKAQTLQTLAQDTDSPLFNFSVQRNVIFKGSATVSNGHFKVNFIVPKDINYPYGFGKISYYAENGTPLDAAGADEKFVIGGNANQIKDDTPPIIQVFLNTDAFVTGGITDANPKVLVKCADDYGMNVSGTSLGHDLTVVLDDNVQETIILNDFYESELNDFRRGQALYPLRNLAAGRHTLKAKGWDIANNPGEGVTEFVVAEDGKAALDHVLNYPNPFTTNTYFQFEHNLAGQILDVQISIFSVSGRLVKTILHSAPADGYRVTDIQWDGKDEYGDQLARGVYVYRVKVRGTDVAGNAVTAESDFEKLVILK
ncbi:MAG: type IX secretion system sortase PorU [Saprospiraceae bacterium]|nr:type IX secretion system sortase PorU [Saprospiraceae bacterium]